MAEPTGQIKDLDGPLSVQGTLRLTRQGGFEVQGTVAPKPGAPTKLTDNLRFLGSPDAARPAAVLTLRHLLGP